MAARQVQKLSLIIAFLIAVALIICPVRAEDQEGSAPAPSSPASSSPASSSTASSTFRAAVSAQRASSVSSQPTSAAHCDGLAAKRHLCTLFDSLRTTNTTPVVLIVSGLTGDGKTYTVQSLAAKFARRSVHDALPNLAVYGPEALSTPSALEGHAKRFVSWCEASSEFEKCIIAFDDYHLVEARHRINASALLGQLCPAKARQSCRRLVLAFLVSASSAPQALWSVEAAGVPSLADVVANATADTANSTLLAGLRETLKLEYNARMMLPIDGSSIKAKVIGHIVPHPTTEDLIGYLHHHFDEVVAPAVKQTYGQNFRVRATAAAIAGIKRSARESSFGLGDFLRWYGTHTYLIVTTQPCSNCRPRDIILIYNENIKNGSFDCGCNSAPTPLAGTLPVSTLKEWTAEDIAAGEACGLKHPFQQLELRAIMDFAQPHARGMLDLYLPLFSYGRGRDPLLLAFLATGPGWGQLPAKTYLLKSLFTSEGDHLNYCSLTINADTIESADSALDMIHAQLHRFSRSVIFIDNAASPRAEPLLHALANLGRVRRLNAFRPSFENLYSGAVFVLDFAFSDAYTVGVVGSDQIASSPDRNANLVALLKDNRLLHSSAKIHRDIDIEIREQMSVRFAHIPNLASRLLLLPFAHYVPSSKEAIRLCFSNAERLDMLIMPPEESQTRIEKFIKEKKDEALPRLLEECGEAKLRELAAGITEERKYIVWDDGELREAATKPTPPV